MPETKKSLNILKVLIKRKEEEKETELDFCLSDGVNSSCLINKDNDKVGLWLGANVMLEYNYADANEMLSQNLLKGEARLEELNKELAFVKTQITTTEVTAARIYNYEILLRREESTENTKVKRIKQKD